jgi:hypothetical protein
MSCPCGQSDLPLGLATPVAVPGGRISPKENVMRNWTHKVVKTALGMQGQRFDFPTAGTFGSESEARAYAERFAHEQRAALGKCSMRYEVRSRGGRTVASYRIDQED